MPSTTAAPTEISTSSRWSAVRAASSPSSACPRPPEPVARAQARPAVVALEEAGAEGGPQLRVPREIADGAEPEALGLLGSDRERVGVGEPEGGADGEPPRLQPSPEGLDGLER